MAKFATQYIPGHHDSEIELAMVMPFANDYPWGRQPELLQLGQVRPGTYLCPIEWDTAGHYPWAITTRPPITLRTLRPGDDTWRWETRITCITPDACSMYYVGSPDEYVRVVIPKASDELSE